MQPQFSEELIREILMFLWQRHVEGEHQYLYWVLLAPILAVVIFTATWYRHRAHLPSFIDALRFFAAPTGPEKMLLYKDLLGNQYALYDYKIAKGENGYIVQAGPHLIKTREDPDSYSEPVSILDARGPPGTPSPFGLFVRWIVAAYIMVAIIAVAFVNTFWTTYSVYSKPLGVPYTTVDLLAFAALVLSSAWLIAVITRAMSPQTLLTTIAAVGVEGKYVLATPGIDVYGSIPPSKVVKTLGGKYEVKVDVKFTVVDEKEKEEKKTVWDMIVEELGDTAAPVLAVIGQIYDVWQKSVGIILQDRYDVSVAGRARYQLSEEKLNVGWLQRHAGIIAFAALIGIVIVAAYMLHPSLGPAANQTIANTTYPVGSVTPAPPPTPPVHAPTATPAQPPSPGFTHPTGG